MWTPVIVLGIIVLVGFLIIPNKNPNAEARYIFRKRQMTLLQIVNELVVNGRIIGTDEESISVQYNNENALLSGMIAMTEAELQHGQPDQSNNVLRIRHPYTR